MDFKRLSSHEKLAVYGAIASIVGPLLSTIGFGISVGWFTLLLGVGMLVIIVLPQRSPQTQLPGSKGSLMLLVGGIAGISALLGLLGLFSIGFIGAFAGLWLLGWLVGIAGGLLMAWAGWQAFQAEGGKFQLGTTGAQGSAGGTPPAGPPPAAGPPPSAPPAAGPPPGPASPPPGPETRPDDRR
jgi:hypothetical protein